MKAENSIQDTPRMTLLDYVMAHKLEVIRETVVKRKCPEDFGLRAPCICCNSGQNKLACLHCWIRPYDTDKAQADLEKAICSVKPLLSRCDLTEYQQSLAIVLQAVVDSTVSKSAESK